MLYNVCCRERLTLSVEMFTAASTLFIFNPICENTRNNTLLIFLYVLVNP